jgi:hypothetical protein
MLPRTYLSDSFPYRRHQHSSSGIGAIEYGRGDHSFSIPEGYDESITMADGLFDDGERIVLVTWLNQTVWPSWDIIITYWDRASGVCRARADIFTFPSAAPMAAPFSIGVEDPEREILGTPVASVSTSGIFGLLGTTGFVYLRSITQAKDGTVWGLFNSFSTVLARAYLTSPRQAYRWSMTTPRQDMRSAQTIAKMIDPTLVTIPSKEIQTPPTTVHEFDQSMDMDTFLDVAIGTTQTRGVATPTLGSGNYASLNFSGRGQMDSDVNIPMLSGWHGWLVIDAASATILVNPLSGYPDVPWNGVALVQNKKVLSFVRVPAYTKALAFEEGTRVWALLEDNTVVSFDYLSGEIFAYFWLPLPYTLGGTNVCITWQRDYRRLLVFAIVRGFQNRGVRNSYVSRIAGYSTTPLPVRVCTPIPLRAVRAGRPSPFLIKQVGSLCEPIAGLAMLTPGEGVTVDRATVPLDDSGEAHVMVTASAEGQATFTASIHVIATWDKPAVATAFRSAEPWIEGSEPYVD